MSLIFALKKKYLWHCVFKLLKFEQYSSMQWNILERIHLFLVQLFRVQLNCFDGLLLRILNRQLTFNLKLPPGLLAIALPINISVIVLLPLIVHD